LTSTAIRAQDGHEYAPVLEKTVNYKSWTLNDLASNKPVALRSLMQERSWSCVVLRAVVSELAQRSARGRSLYEKYKSQALRLSVSANMDRATT